MSGYSERAWPHRRSASSLSFRADSTRIARWRLKHNSRNVSIVWIQVTLEGDQAEAGELSGQQREPLGACAGWLGASQGRTGQGGLRGRRLQQGQGGSQQRSRDQRAAPASQPHRTGGTYQVGVVIGEREWQLKLIIDWTNLPTPRYK